MDVDTIAAVSTAAGVGAIAVVRVSGPGADTVLARLAPDTGGLPEERRATLVQLRDPDDGTLIDRAVVVRWVAPTSYTGENVVEFSCHGGVLIPDLVLDACVRAGARKAEPGEFTRRAYLRGKLDLVQVEAVADLIEARNRALHRAALSQLERGLSARLAELREAIVEIEALLVHHLDFPEEDDPPVPMSRIVDAAGSIVERLDRMLATAPEGEMLREGALTVLAGRPNAGKSSIYNALLGEERAIVTEEPGTTRDALEATVQLGGYPFRLVDTAGLRETDARIERMGIEVARRYLQRADLVLFCVPVDETWTEDDERFLDEVRETPVVILETKADRVEGGGPVVERSTGGRHGARERMAADRVRVSVLDGRGLDELRVRLPELVYSSVVHSARENPVVTRARQTKGLTEARDEVAAFRSALLSGLPAEVASTHLRPAETALEELLGVVSLDDVLDVVFREFCVGK